VSLFSLEGIGTSNAVFNPEKLDWLNAAHIMRMSLGELSRRIEPLLRDAGLWNDDLVTTRMEWWHGVLTLLQPRLKMLRDGVEQARPFLARDVVFDQKAVEKNLRVPGIAGHLVAFVSAIEDVPFDAASLEGVLRGVAESRGVKAAALIHATRVAITGRAVSPGLFETMTLLGRETVVARIAGAVREIATHNGSK
jgi:glutamyl-tRNA synthetase